MAWIGDVAVSSLGYALFSTAGESPSGSCEQPYCDTSTLKVEGGGNLTLQAASESPGLNEIDIALEKADGTVVVFSGDTKAKGTIKNLAAGTYPVYIWGVVGASSGSVAFDYTASAELPAAAPAPAPASPAPGGSAPAPAAQQPATLSAKVGKASARKLNKRKRLTFKLSSSAQVDNVVATLTSGKRTVGKARLAGFQGSGSVALRLSKKLKKGRCTLKVTATDAATGKPVATPAKVRVNR